MITNEVTTDVAEQQQQQSQQPQQQYPKKRNRKRNNSKGILLPNEIGVTKESPLKADKEERLRVIYRMSDEIRGLNFNMEAAANFRSHHHKNHNHSNKNPKIVKWRDIDMHDDDPPKIVVAVEGHIVMVGINTRNRPGLLLDISSCLHRDLHLDLCHTEAAVIGKRSVSIWRTE